MSMMGWGYAQNTKILFRAEVIPRKHHFWSFLAITIPVCQIQMILTLIPLQNQHVGMGICAKHTNFILSWNILLKNLHYLSFLAITIPVYQIQMILTLIRLKMSMMGWVYAQNTQILFWAEHIAQKPSLFVVFGYNNSSVSNPNDFNTHTSSKSTCWDGDMRKTYKFYFELNILLKNLHYLSFFAITIPVCQIQMILTLIPLPNRHVGMRICAKHTNFILN